MCAFAGLYAIPRAALASGVWYGKLDELQPNLVGEPIGNCDHQGDTFFIEHRSSGETAALGRATCPNCEEKMVVLADRGTKATLDLTRLPRF
jgi:hypothetical protein